jgi:signal transduction histidine kinase/CheY-like chemotaxis protein/ligand-binding sensor domain-containing protein
MSLNPGFRLLRCPAALCLALLLWTTRLGAAPDPHLRFKHLHLKDGLSQVTVVDILQDRQGFLWFTSDDGINRYDGYQVVTYRSGGGLTGSATINVATCLLEDRDGMIWIGTQSGGLSRFDPKSGDFVSFSHDESRPQTLPSGKITRLLEGREEHGDSLWVASEFQGLFRFNKATGVTQPIPMPSFGDSAVPRISALIEEPGSRGSALWVGSSAGLHRYDTVGNTWDPVPLRTGPLVKGQEPWVRALTFSDNRTLWAGTNGQGLVRLNIRSGEQVHHGANSSLPDLFINVMMADSDGHLWLGTQRGLAVFLPETGTFHTYLNNPSIDWSLSDNTVMSLLQDRSGLLWVGTWNAGVNMTRIRPGSFHTTFHVPGDPESLINNNVRDVLLDRSGELWVATAAGLDRFDKGTGGWIHHRHDPGRRDSLPYNFITDLFEDSRGLLWVGTQRGLSRYERQTDSFTSFFCDPDDTRTLSSSYIQRIVDDPTDPGSRLLVGTRENGFNRFHKETGVSERIVDLGKRTDSSGGGSGVYTFLVQRPERIWLGTFENGLVLWDSQKNRFERFATAAGQSVGLSNERISCLSADPDEDENIIWVGTWGNGLVRLDSRSRHTRGYDTGSGFPTNMISSIITDPEKWFWISTPQGIFRFNPRSGEYKQFEVLVGDTYNAFSPGAAHQTPEGEIFFGGLFGFTRFFPDRVRANPIPPPLVMTSMRVMDQELIGLRTAGYDRLLELTRQDRMITFQFAALAYAMPQKNGYRYRLEGFADDWISVSAKQRSATFTNLEPGRYRFQVQGSNEDGVWNEAGLSLDMVVRPPFWSTLWFRLLMLMVLVMLVFGAVQLRLRRLKRRERDLQHLVDSRTRQLVRINQLIQTINAEADISGLLYAILREMSAFLPVDRASALIWNEKEGLFRVQVPYNYAQSDGEALALTENEAHDRYTQAAETLAPDLFRVTDVSGRAGHEKLVHMGLAKVLLVFRIPGERHVEGYLILENLDNADAFAAESDVELLERLRDPVVMAFRKAKMIQDLEEQRAAAERANLLKSRFLANMSHEIRTPMNAILGFTQLLCKDEEDLAKREQLQIIGRAGENLLNLINDILDFSKIESEMIEIVPVTFSLRKMLRHLEDLFRLRAEEKSLYFRLHIQDRVPRYLFGDSFRLNQVLVNLVGNAIKFTQTGGITIHADYREGLLILGVADTGIGIPADKHELIFQPFVQADDSTTREFGGTGLGLSICHKVVSLMKGSLLVQSSPGSGSVFRLTLPIDRVDEAEAGGLDQEGVSEPKTWQGGEKVLGIIEDQQSDLALLEAILRRNGYGVTEIHNDGTVVEQILDQSVELVLLDMVMNGLDGMAVNELLKRDVRTAHLPVIAVSGSRMAQACMNFGILDYIRKPVREDELLKRIFVTLSVPQQIQNVFIIDDDPMMVALYGAFLRKFHYNTFSFNCAQDALQSLEKGIVPDVIILDLMMPRVSGFEFLRLLRDKYHLQTPVVVVTAKDLDAAELEELRQDTLAIFPKGRETGVEFISFLNSFFQRRDLEGQQRLQRWQEQLDSPEIRALLMEALDTLPTRVRSLGQAVHAGQWEEAEHLSHDLKGLCANLGITEVADQAHEINRMIRSGPQDETEHLGRVMAELNLIVSAIPRGQPLSAGVNADEDAVKMDGEISILVVEDEPINRRLAETYLRKLGRNCSTAANGLEALKIMRHRAHDLVFLDIQMPVMGGLEVLAHIRGDGTMNRAFVVALTANAIKGDEEKYLGAGCDAYLPKPVSLAAIEDMIERAIAAKRARS